MHVCGWLVLAVAALLQLRGVGAPCPAHALAAFWVVEPRDLQELLEARDVDRLRPRGLLPETWRPETSDRLTFWNLLSFHCLRESQAKQASMPSGLLSTAGRGPGGGPWRALRARRKC